MERHKSALKAARQAVKRQAQNHSARSAFRSTIKKFQATLAKGSKEQIFAELNKVQSVLMKAASKNLIHAGNASRRIGRLSAAAHKAVKA